MLPNEKMLNMSIDQSMIMDIDQIIDITSAPITEVLCFSSSITKKLSVIGTKNGFCLINNLTKSFRRFEHNLNPFSSQLNTGVQLASPLEQRPEVAITPSKSSKSFSPTSIYIYSYQLRTLLYSTPFFLPIHQLTLTDTALILSNNRRIILYKYGKDNAIKNQEYYLKQYANNAKNQILRYLEMGCEEKFGNNTIVEEGEGEDGIGQGTIRSGNECACGRYVISHKKPYKIAYVKVFTVNGVKNIQISMYDQAYDKDYIVQSVQWNNNFQFSLNEDGTLLSYTINQGRTINIIKIGQKGIFAQLSVSSSIKQIMGSQLFSHDDSLWYTVVRNGGNGNAHMHFFKLPKNRTEQLQKSRYSRYFSLYERTMKDYSICNQLINPQFYIVNGAVYASSVTGVVVEIIDLKISGNHAKKNVENMVKWKEEII